MGLTLIPASTLSCIQVTFLKAEAGMGGSSSQEPTPHGRLQHHLKLCPAGGQTMAHGTLRAWKVQTQLTDLNFWLHLGAV